MITWTSQLETGTAFVDADHKQLIAQLNALHDALQRGEGKDRLVEMIVFLNRYAREHFAREEEHMQQVGCAAYADNCRAHDAFVVKLERWITQLKTAGSSTTLLLEVHREACAWIQGHIVGIDCKLRGCRS